MMTHNSQNLIYNSNLSGKLTRQANSFTSFRTYFGVVLLNEINCLSQTNRQTNGMEFLKRKNPYTV